MPNPSPRPSASPAATAVQDSRAAVPQAVASSAAGQEGGWEDEDESLPTQTYSPQHLQTALGRPRVPTPSRVQVAPSEPDVRGAEPSSARPLGARAPQSVDPATAAALASIQPLIKPTPVRPERINVVTRAYGPVNPPSPRASRRTLMGVQPPAITPRPAPQSRPTAEIADVTPAEEPHLAIAVPDTRPHIVAAPSPRAGGSWFGWAVATALVAFGVAFYAGAYAPLRGELAQAKQASATQAAEHSAALSSLQADLQRTRSEIEQLTAAAQAAPAMPNEPAESVRAARAEKAASPPAEPKSAEPKKSAEPHTADTADTERLPRVAKRKPESSEPKPSHNVDRSAAAAATAELEAQAYGSVPPPPAPKTAELAPEPNPAPAAAPAPATKEPLSDVENEPSDDPLEGL